jgi:hypothetical protein
MKKPGQKDEIARALQTCSDQGWKKGLNFGIIIGWPDETEEEFFETIEFLDWAVSLGVMRALSIIPMYRTQGMMDDSLLRDAEGEAKGLAWRLPTAAGSPAVRARRYFHVFEHFTDLALVQSPVPHHVVVNKMLGGQPPGFWERWIAKRGEHPVDNRMEEPTQAGAGVFSVPPVVGTESPLGPIGAAAPDTLPWSVRTLVGRGATVVLQLNPDPEADALARVGAHGFSHEGDLLPEPLRDVVLEMSRAVGGLARKTESTDEIWTEVARFVETIASDVRLA